MQLNLFYVLYKGILIRIPLKQFTTTTLLILFTSLSLYHISFAQTAEQYNEWGLAKGSSKSDWQGAIADYSKAIELDPNYIPAYMNRAFARNITENYKGVIDDYTVVISLDPNLYAAYYGRALAYGKLRKFKEEIADLDIYLKHDPKSFFGFLARGDAKMILGDYEGAIEDYTINIKLEPQSTMGYRNRAVAEFKLDQIEAGCKDMKKAGELGFILADDYLKKYCKN